MFLNLLQDGLLLEVIGSVKHIVLMSWKWSKMSTGLVSCFFTPELKEKELAV